MTEKFQCYSVYPLQPGQEQIMAWPFFSPSSSSLKQKLLAKKNLVACEMLLCSSLLLPSSRSSALKCLPASSPPWAISHSASSVRVMNSILRLGLGRKLKLSTLQRRKSDICLLLLLKSPLFSRSLGSLKTSAEILFKSLLWVWSFGQESQGKTDTCSFF